MITFDRRFIIVAIVIIVIIVIILLSSPVVQNCSFFKIGAASKDATNANGPGKPVNACHQAQAVITGTKPQNNTTPPQPQGEVFFESRRYDPPVQLGKPVNSAHQQQSKIVEYKGPISELFSWREDVERDYGVKEEQLEAMAEQYKKIHYDTYKPGVPRHMNWIPDTEQEAEKKLEEGMKLFTNTSLRRDDDIFEYAHEKKAREDIQNSRNLISYTSTKFV